MRIITAGILFALCLQADAGALGGHKSKPSDVQKWLASERVNAINDMAPRIGLNAAEALKGKATFKTCSSTGKNGDGPYICGKEAPCAEIQDCVHAWCIPDFGGNTRYMFATGSGGVEQAIRVWCVRHEVMHELLDGYGISGHPLKVTVKRKDNGKAQTFKPGEVINGRWPSMVNALIPESLESKATWGDAACGTEERLMDGAGI